MTQKIIHFSSVSQVYFVYLGNKDDKVRLHYNCVYHKCNTQLVTAGFSTRGLSSTDKQCTSVDGI